MDKEKYDAFKESVFPNRLQARKLRLKDGINFLKSLNAVPLKRFVK